MEEQQEKLFGLFLEFLDACLTARANFETFRDTGRQSDLGKLRRKKQNALETLLPHGLPPPGVLHRHESQRRRRALRQQPGPIHSPPQHPSSPLLPGQGVTRKTFFVI